MAIVSGDREGDRNFLNYALNITRKDLQTGERLAVRHFMLTKPFFMVAIDPGQSLGRAIQGAADGSEERLQG